MRSSATAVLTVARAQPVLAAFTVSYLGGFLLLGLGLGRPLGPAYFAVVSALVVVVSFVERRFRLGPGLLWALSAWGFAHMAGGVVGVDDQRVLYNVWLVPGLLRYDQAVHAVGFGSATVACGRVLGHWVPQGGPRVGPAVLAALAGMGLGALNEVAEFLATLVLAETNVGGFHNTGWDLVFDLFGAVAASAWLAWSTGSSLPGAAQGTRCESGAVPQL